VDKRGFNSQGFASGQAVNLRSYIQYLMYRGTDYAFEEDESGSGTFTMDLESSAYSGGHTGDGGKANAGSLLLYSERTGGSRPVWGTDINVQCHNLNNFCNGIEVDMVNQSAGIDSGGTMNGEIIIASSSGGVNTNTLGTGLVIQGSGGLWKFGETIESYTTSGLNLIPNAGRNSDVSVVPPADDTALEFIGRNHANTSNVWTIDDSGNSVFASVGAQVLAAGTRATIPVHTPSSSSEACIAGTITFDSNYLYTCVATNTWRRVATSSF
jgi:hypothetical protein